MKQVFVTFYSEKMPDFNFKEFKPSCTNAAYLNRQDKQNAKFESVLN